jgi:hypothetical protein
MVSYEVFVLHVFNYRINMNWFVIPAINTNISAFPIVRTTAVGMTKQMDGSFVAVVPIANWVMEQNKSLPVNFQIMIVFNPFKILFDWLDYLTRIVITPY